MMKCASVASEVQSSFSMESSLATTVRLIRFGQWDVI